jgi:hypothetical protein
MRDRPFTRMVKDQEGGMLYSTYNEGGSRSRKKLLLHYRSGSKKTAPTPLPPKRDVVRKEKKRKEEKPNM